jgi:DNA-binding PadR family transcriptional regulator
MKAELLILGVLHRGDFHPYEIKRRLMAAMVECYIDVDTGTLYYAIRQLAKDRLIATRARQAVARGGMRTVYGITAKGRERFQTLLHECFEGNGPVSSTLYGALIFLHLSDPKRVAPLLRARLERQDELIRKLKDIRKDFEPRLSTGGLQLLEHLDLQRRLDRKWMAKLLTEVEAGRVRDVPDPRQLEAPRE